MAALLDCGSTGAQDLRIEHVTIVSPESAREIRDASVTIHAGRIQDISTPTSAAPKSGATALQTLDGTNLYLIPGLIDSHVHLGGIPGMTDEQEKAHPDIAGAAVISFLAAISIPGSQPSST